MSRDEQFTVASLKEAIQDGRVAMIGPIRQEVLSGIKTAAQFEKLRTALMAFPDVPLTAHYFEEAARLSNFCRNHGVECGSTEILICAVAAELRYGILTYDKGLQRCIQLLRTEGVLR